MESLADLLGGSPEMVAEATVPEHPEVLFDMLTDLERHWQLGGRRTEVLSLEGPPGHRTGGRVRLHGPFGLSRVARTRVLATHEPRWITGSAELAGGTLGMVAWLLEPVPEGTRLHLGARVEWAGRLDRLLLRLGARRWLQGMLAGTLEGLGSPYPSERGVGRPQPCSADFAD
jgi:hypothetical protein